MALEAAILNLPRPKRVKTPLLVLGAENDRVFTVAEQRKTARAYETEAIIYPDMAHDMMLEPGWGVVADQILSWFKSHNL
jgi:alpha-beta hydrolase superfamily lysophospholipase